MARKAPQRREQRHSPARSRPGHDHPAALTAPARLTANRRLAQRTRRLYTAPTVKAGRTAGAATKPIVVAGHVCLDIIPAFAAGASRLDELLVPGKLVDVGPATIATGGAVANTGLALHRLGLPVRPVGKIGADAFGRTIVEIFRAAGVPADGLVADPQAATSYTVVINPPGLDRVFLHCPGANDLFGADDLPAAALDGASMLHFGYPPLMRRMYADGGGELAALLERGRGAGLTTSLDLALPDPQSPAGRADWPRILRRGLPLVDVCVPSLDEIVYMLDRRRGEEVRRRTAAGVPLGGLAPDDVRAAADALIAQGVAIAMIKLGEQGVFLRVTPDAGRLAAGGAAAPADPSAWAGATCHAPCFEAAVAGTTGAGDCAIAGFLAALAQGCGPQEALRMAAAAGAASVERPDATSGVPPWPQLAARVAAGWPRNPAAFAFPETV